MNGLDLMAATMPDLPPQWETVEPDVLATLRPEGGIYTPQQHAALKRIAGRRWFLIRANTGLASRCRECQQVHTYLTLGCVELPFNGLTEVIGLFDRYQGRDRVIDAVALGDIVPITRDEARTLYGRIRARGYEL
jgi:hypothetical protein